MAHARRTDAVPGGSSGTLIDVGYPTTAESARLSPTRPAAVPQDHLETILIKYLRTLPDAHVDLGVAVEDIWPTVNGFGLRLRTEASGADRVVEAGYLVGADGPRSVVRQCLGVGVQSTEEVLHSFSAVVRAPLWDVVGRHRYGIYVTEIRLPAHFCLRAQGDRWVYAFSWDPRTESMLT